MALIKAIYFSDATDDILKEIRKQNINFSALMSVLLQEWWRTKAIEQGINKTNKLNQSKSLKEQLTETFGHLYEFNDEGNIVKKIDDKNV